MNKNIKIDKNNKLIKQDQENQRKYASKDGVGNFFPWNIQRDNPNVIFLPNKRGKKRY